MMKLLCLVGLCCLATVNDDEALDRALNTLARTGSNVEGAREALAVVEAQLKAGDRLNWDRAFAIVDDATVPINVRTRVLDVLARTAHVSQLGLLIESGKRWITVARKPAHGDPALVYRLLDRIEEEKFWRGVSTSVPLAEFLAVVGSYDTRVDPRKRAQAITLLGRLETPRNALRRLIVDLIRSGPRMETVPVHLEPLVRNDIADELREMVKMSGPLHCLGAAALAHIGDEGIRGEFARRMDAGERQPLLERLLWQIDVQQDHDKLVDRIAAVDGVHGAIGQRWALRRALQLGVDKERLRTAVLQFAEAVEPDRALDGRSLPAAALIDLRELAVGLGILNEGDLPEVPRPARRGRGG